MPKCFVKTVFLILCLVRSCLFFVNLVGTCVIAIVEASSFRGGMPYTSGRFKHDSMTRVVRMLKQVS